MNRRTVSMRIDYLPELDNVVPCPEGVGVEFDLGVDQGDFGHFAMLSIRNAKTGEPVLVDFQVYHAVANVVRSQTLGTAKMLDSIIAEARF